MAKENPQTRIQTRLQERSQQYSLKEIFKRIDEGSSEKDPTIAELKEKVNRIRQDLMELSIQVQNLISTVLNRTEKENQLSKDHQNPRRTSW